MKTITLVNDLYFPENMLLSEFLYKISYLSICGVIIPAGCTVSVKLEVEEPKKSEPKAISDKAKKVKINRRKMGRKSRTINQRKK